MFGLRLVNKLLVTGQRRIHTQQKKEGFRMHPYIPPRVRHHDLPRWERKELSPKGSWRRGLTERLCLLAHLDPTRAGTRYSHPLPRDLQFVSHSQGISSDRVTY